MISEKAQIDLFMKVADSAISNRLLIEVLWNVCGRFPKVIDRMSWRGQLLSKYQITYFFHAMLCTPNTQESKYSFCANI